VPLAGDARSTNASQSEGLVGHVSLMARGVRRSRVEGERGLRCGSTPGAVNVASYL
jgi:hypothetical protein